MNLRRYALFFTVAILTFVLGVTAAVMFRKVNPFSRGHQTRKSCVRLTALPDHRSKLTVYTVYRQDGTVVKSYEVDSTYGLERLGAKTEEAAPPPPVAPAAPGASR
jgi:hypothetical protein